MAKYQALRTGTSTLIWISILCSSGQQFSHGRAVLDGKLDGLALVPIAPPGQNHFSLDDLRFVCTCRIGQRKRDAKLPRLEGRAANN